MFDDRLIKQVVMLRHKGSKDAAERSLGGAGESAPRIRAIWKSRRHRTITVNHVQEKWRQNRRQESTHGQQRRKMK